MKLPEVENADKYTGLFVVDFGNHCGVGFVAEEVAELLESEQFADVQVYQVHRANPDGTMELKGVHKATFQLEAGMFFYAADAETAQGDYQRLLAWSDTQLPPARCKVQLADTDNAPWVALIYPAEFDEAFSCWLLDGNYRTAGEVQGGTGAVQRYYDSKPNVLKHQQLWPASSIEHLQGEALLEATSRAIVR
ncbi:MAG: hypothetical protein B6I25_01165 [Planctomycetales bacterium 4572_13]|nr:MAG: hypothetical protein B6I25_01165 [Planctomycetales bacterium 4572_13]